MKDNNITRRDFFKKTGAASAAVTAVSMLPLRAQSSQSGKMTYRENPNNNDKVSLLGYGCMRWQMTEDQQVNQESVNELVDKALASGINYFDTAPVYCRGLSETATGIALKRYPRDSYYIATKLSSRGNSKAWPFEESKKMYLNSLKNLQTDYIDYYLLHSIGGEGSIERLQERFFDNKVIDFLLKEREAGRIRNLGFSFHGDTKLFNWMLDQHDKVHWDFVQIQMNYIDWHHASASQNSDILYNALAEKNIPVVIMEPLLGGRLASVPNHIAERLLEKEPTQSIASWAFRFCGTYPKVLTVLSGMTYMEHLEDNLKTFSPLKPLNEEELAFLDDTAELMAQYPIVGCTDCKYCMPCEYGIDIPSIFKHYNKCVNEGTMPENDENYKKARRAFLIGYDRTVPRLRQADMCIECRKCVSRCPQRINIPSELRKIDRFVEKLKQGKEL